MHFTLILIVAHRQLKKKKKKRNKKILPSSNTLLNMQICWFSVLVSDLAWELWLKTARGYDINNRGNAVTLLNFRARGGSCGGWADLYNLWWGLNLYWEADGAAFSTSGGLHRPDPVSVNVCFMFLSTTRRVRPSPPSCTWGWCLAGSDPRIVCTCSWGTPSPLIWSPAPLHLLETNTKQQEVLFWSPLEGAARSCIHLPRETSVSKANVHSEQRAELLLALNTPGWRMSDSGKSSKFEVSSMLLISMEMAAGRSLRRQDGGDHGRQFKHETNVLTWCRRGFMLHVPDVLPVHWLEKLMTLNLLHTHSSNPVLSIGAIPGTRTHLGAAPTLFGYVCRCPLNETYKTLRTSISSLWPSPRWGLQGGRRGFLSSSSPSCTFPEASQSRRGGSLNTVDGHFNSN